MATRATAIALRMLLPRRSATRGGTAGHVLTTVEVDSTTRVAMIATRTLARATPEARGTTVTRAHVTTDPDITATTAVTSVRRRIDIARRETRSATERAVGIETGTEVATTDEATLEPKTTTELAIDRADDAVATIATATTNATTQNAATMTRESDRVTGSPSDVTVAVRESGIAREIGKRRKV